MSTRELRAPPLMYMRNSRRRKMVLDVDLNVPPPSENRDQNQEGSSAHAGSQQTGQQGGSAPPPPPPPAIDLEAIDDDVIISSPRAFAEAINNSRRTQERTVVVDVDSEAGSSRVIPYHRTKRRRLTQNAPNSANPTIINCDLFINLDGSSNYLRENVQIVAPLPPPGPPPPPPPKEPTFSCPVCMGPLVEEMSTKCGHIFCKSCIKAAITAQSKCPTCRRKVTMKDTIRVYLPTIN